MKPILTTCAALLALTALSYGNAAADPSPPPVPAGAYTLDKAHASLTLRVDHVGFSKYTAQFARFDSQLQFDPQRPEAASVKVTIDPASLELTNPPDGFLDQLRGPQWLATAKFPTITFQSLKVTRTGANTLRIDGNLDLHGVRQPITLDATYNGGYAGHPMDPHARIGFSAHGTFKRSLFGIAYGIPAPGTTMGVSDAVEVIVEAEFSGPPLRTAAPANH